MTDNAEQTAILASIASANREERLRRDQLIRESVPVRDDALLEIAIHESLTQHVTSTRVLLPKEGSSRKQVTECYDPELSMALQASLKSGCAMTEHELTSRERRDAYIEQLNRIRRQTGYCEFTPREARPDGNCLLWSVDVFKLFDVSPAEYANNLRDLLYTDPRMFASTLSEHADPKSIRETELEMSCGVFGSSAIQAICNMAHITIHVYDVDLDDYEPAVYVPKSGNNGCRRVDIILCNGHYDALV